MLESIISKKKLVSLMAFSVQMAERELNIFVIGKRMSTNLEYSIINAQLSRSIANINARKILILLVFSYASAPFALLTIPDYL